MAQIFKPSANTIARGSALLMGALPLVLFYAGSTITRGPANTNATVPINQPVPFSHLHHVMEVGLDCRYCHVGVEKSPTASIPPTETCMSCHSQIWTNSPLLEPVRKSYETGTPIAWSTGEVGWNQVNKAPDFVFFRHDIHINRGVSCNNCHGPIQKMTITYKQQAFSMAWCLECHKNPEKYIYKDPQHPELSPREQVFNFYRKLQKGDPLSPREQQLADGGGQGTDDPAEIAKGEQLLTDYKIKKQQLADCWICHR